MPRYRVKMTCTHISLGEKILEIEEVNAHEAELLALSQAYDGKVTDWEDCGESCDSTEYSVDRVEEMKECPDTTAGS